MDINGEGFDSWEWSYLLKITLGASVGWKKTDVRQPLVNSLYNFYIYECMQKVNNVEDRENIRQVNLKNNYFLS